MTTATDAALEQRMTALASANRKRLAIAALKRKLGTGEIRFDEIDFDDPDLQGVKVFDLLRSLPWHRRPRVSKQPTATRGPTRVLQSVQMSSWTTVRAIGSRRAALIAAVNERCPSQR